MFGTSTTRGLVFTLVLGFAAPALSAVDHPPLPRTKPKTATRSVMPKPKPVHKFTASIVRPPLPRPKPNRHQQSLSESAAQSLGKAVSTERGGRLVIALPGLGRERDPDKSAELQPAPGKAWSASQIKQARQRCDLVLATTNVAARKIKPIGGPGGCGIAAPVKVSSLGAVRVKPAATINCTMAAALYKWMVDEVQPAALSAFKEPVVQIRNAASYSCRRRNNLKTGRISEHSFGNALDISTFVLASGKRITVLKDWSAGFASAFGFNRTGGFLIDIHKGACRTFSTVLGPEANKAHDNHFHVDLGRAGRNKFCK